MQHRNGETTAEVWNFFTRNVTHFDLKNIANRHIQIAYTNKVFAENYPCLYFCRSQFSL